MYASGKILKHVTKLAVRPMVLVVIALFISIIYIFSNALVHRSNDFTISRPINITTTSISVPPESPPKVISKNNSLRKMEQRKNKSKHSSNHQAICNHVLPPKVWSMVHHKTGHDFSWSLGGALKNYCKDRKGRITTELSINKFLLQCKPHNCVYLHWVRHPLNTIISGFYYHLKTDEEWVHLWTIKTSVNTAIDMDTDTLFFDVLNDTVDDTHFYSKYRKEVIVRPVGSYGQRLAQRRTKGSKLLHCFNVGESTLFHRYIHNFLETYINNNIEYILDGDVTLQTFYRRLNKLDYKIGLFWEFVRYTKCEWASIYVLQQIGDKYFKNVAEYDIDDFIHRNFDESVNKLLDQLNVVDNGINTQKLQSDVNITHERMRIVAELKQLDVSQMREIGNNHLKMHITYNQYNLEQVINDLLSLNIGICKLIKTMTLLLRFGWDHSEHC